MGRKRKDIRVIRAQVLFSVRANKNLPAAGVVYIMNMKNEYWYEREIKNTNPGKRDSSFAVGSSHLSLSNGLD